MLEKTVQLSKSVSITVHAETGRDLLAKRSLYKRVTFNSSDDLEVEQAITFIYAVTQTSKVEGNIGFVWPSPSSSPKELDAAFAAWLALPGWILRPWLDALDQISMPPGDLDLFPAEELDPKGSPTLTS